MARKRAVRRARESTTLAAQVLETPDATLLDILDRLLTKGVMVNGDLVLGVAGVDLIYLRLSSLLCAADWLLPHEMRPTGRKRGRDIYSPTTGRIPAGSERGRRRTGPKVAKSAKNHRQT